METKHGIFTNNELTGQTAEEVYQKWLNLNYDFIDGEWVKKEQIDICLDDLKIEKIKNSKSQLESWLQNNPMFSTVHNPSGEYYTVTDGKQSLLARNLLLAQLSKSPTTTWNSTSNICEEWTVETLAQLALEIESYVRPRIVKQQHYEVAINLCTTKEELGSITFDYGVI